MNFNFQKTPSSIWVPFSILLNYVKRMQLNGLKNFIHCVLPKMSMDTQRGWISSVLIVTYALIYFLIGEKLTIQNGLGWDGLTYAAYASDFFHEITTTSDVYHVTRIFPSFLIFCFTKSLGVMLDTPHAIFVAFYLLNNLMFISVGLLWHKICKLKKITPFCYWIGFISFFMNYASLKLAQYAPVFLDPCVLFLGILALYLYLKRKYIALCMVLFFVYFTWPIAIILALPLIVYHFNEKNNTTYGFSHKICGIGLGALFIVCSITLLYILYYQNDWIVHWTSVRSCWHEIWWSTDRRIFYSIIFVVPCGLVITCVYLYWVGYHAAFFRVIHNSYRVHLPYTIGYGLFLIFTLFVAYWLSHLSTNYNGTTLFSGSEFLALTALGAIAKPGLSFIMHATFLGPWAILWLFYMGPVIHAANEESFGFVVFMIITCILALNCHSRQLTFNVPFIIYCLCRVLDRIQLINKKLFLIYFLLAALVGSKIYYLINVAPLQGSIVSYPLQRFFMNFGLGTTWTGYFFNLVLVVLMCTLLYKGGAFASVKRGNSYCVTKMDDVHIIHPI